MTFYTAVRETGTIIDEFNTYDEAIEAIKTYEETDMVAGTYEPDFYDIVNAAHEHIEGDEGKRLALPDEYVISPTIPTILKLSGLTQTALARRFDIPLRTVQDWCSGKRKAPQYVIDMIATILLTE